MKGIVAKFLLVIMGCFCWSFITSASEVEKGKNLIQTAQYKEAIWIFRNALIKCNNSCQDSTIAELYLYQGKAYQYVQKYDSSLFFFNQGLNLYKKKQHLNGLVKAQIFIAEFYRHIGNYNQSMKTFGLVEKSISDPNLSPENRAFYYNRYAALLSEMDGDNHDIIYFLKKSTELAEQFNLKSIEAASRNQLGFYYDAKKRIYPSQQEKYIENPNDKLAIKYFNEALNIYTELNDTRSVVDICINIARYYHNIREYEKSIKICEYGLEVMDDNDWLLSKKELNYYMSRDYNYLGDYQRALEFFQIYHKYDSQLRESILNKNLKEVETKFEVEKKDNEIKLAKKETEVVKMEAKQRKKQFNNLILISVLLFFMVMILIFATIKIKRTNTLLNHSVEEKEILFQEVHHRIKNNLTLLKSLLYLRGNACDNEEVKLILAECQSRIHSMAIVHQNLYDVEDVSHVDYEIFLEQLITESHELFGSENLKLNSIIETNGIFLEMGTAVFLGLIINELLTNSFKYSFNDEKENFINIRMSKIGDNVSVNFQDSGKGLPDNYQSLSAKDGFGFRLINILLKQIDATMNYSKENNTFVLNLKLK